MLPSQPKIEPIPGPWWRPSYRVTEDWHCVWRGRDGKTHRILVPEGMLLDGSTEWLVLALGILPAWLFWILGVSQDGLHRAAVVAHDRAYSVAGRLRIQTLTADRWVMGPSRISRRDADWMLLEVQRTSGVWAWRRYPRWATVRIFGAPVWRRRRVRS